MSLVDFRKVHLTAWLKDARCYDVDGNVIMGPMKLSPMDPENPNHRTSVDHVIVENIHPPFKMTDKLRIKFDANVAKHGRQASFYVCVDLIKYVPMMESDFVRRVGQAQAQRLTATTLKVADNVFAKLTKVAVTSADIFATTDPTVFGVAIEAWAMLLLQNMCSIDGLMGHAADGSAIANLCASVVCSLARVIPFDGTWQFGGAKDTSVIAIEIKSGFGDQSFSMNKHWTESGVLLRVQKEILTTFEKHGAKRVTCKMIVFVTTHTDRLPNVKCKY